MLANSRFSGSQTACAVFLRYAPNYQPRYGDLSSSPGAVASAWDGEKIGLCVSSAIPRREQTSNEAGGAHGPTLRFVESLFRGASFVVHSSSNQVLDFAGLDLDRPRVHGGDGQERRGKRRNGRRRAGWARPWHLFSTTTTAKLIIASRTRFAKRSKARPHACVFHFLCVWGVRQKCSQWTSLYFRMSRSFQKETN